MHAPAHREAVTQSAERLASDALLAADEVQLWCEDWRAAGLDVRLVAWNMATVSPAQWAQAHVQNTAGRSAAITRRTACRLQSEKSSRQPAWPDPSIARF